MPREARKRLRRHERQLKLERNRSNDSKTKSDAESESDSDSDTDDEPKDIDRLTLSDAYAFPILASLVLVALYVAFNFLSAETINRLIGGYMGLMGVGSLARAAVCLFRSALLSRRAWDKLPKWTVRLEQTRRPRRKDRKGEKLKANKGDRAAWSTPAANVVHLAAIGLALGVSVVQSYRPHWIVSNAVALAFAFNAVGLLRLDSFLTGSVLLALLFIYDIWSAHVSQSRSTETHSLTAALSFPGGCSGPNGRSEQTSWCPLRPSLTRRSKSRSRATWPAQKASRYSASETLSYPGQSVRAGRT